MQNVLVTGMSGLIGQALKTRLEGRYTLAALNRSEVAGVTCHRGDISDLEAIRPAFAGQDVVVHLAAHVEVPGTIENMIRYNVLGTYNVFEAAREAGVKRVVFASSGAAIAAWEKEEPYATLSKGKTPAEGTWPMITHETPIRPNGLYGCSKVWGEALARHYTDTSDLSIICVRIGRVHGEDRPLGPRDKAVWCSQRDIAALLEACMAAPPALKYDVVFGVSRNRLNYRDLAHTRDAVGWSPEDSSDAFE